MQERRYYVYILTNHSRTLYVGMTNDLSRRVEEHKAKEVPGFTAKYGIDQLVHYEVYSRALDAIEREKQIKRWRRAKKVALIMEDNPHWEDLGA